MKFIEYLIKFLEKKRMEALTNRVLKLENSLIDAEFRVLGNIEKQEFYKDNRLDYINEQIEQLNNEHMEVYKNYVKNVEEQKESLRTIRKIKNRMFD